MRKYHYNQILNVLQSLREVQKAEAYADCQDAACGLMDFIEGIMGMDTETVALLEEYCKLVFRVHSGESEKDVLKKSLHQIEITAKREFVSDKIEVVFLSYKAAMSDSIESIYLAAKEDPDCDAYWIPIPYFDKNPDGSFGKMHCEADQYPDYIEVTDWRQYDVATRRPDVIFTFAPYDGGNYVTSVHPDFYCERLRGLTDCLVYVPYFVSPFSVKSHFCVVPGCVFAHKVVLQSNRIRDTYIREFKNAYSTRFGNPDDKFVAFGSPKFDKVINTQRENCELPPNLAKLVAHKKVVLYNTTLGSILEGKEQFLAKLRSVIDTFRECNDVVLWWRPHPLSLSTYESMLPRLATEYGEIVAEYQAAGFGIYDDSSDLHRAIAMSDAYYGGGGSVVSLYVATGKPLMYPLTKSATGNEKEILTACMSEYNYGIGDFSFERVSDFVNHVFSENNVENIHIVQKKQIESSALMTENITGTCGNKIYEFIKKVNLK